MKISAKLLGSAPTEGPRRQRPHPAHTRTYFYKWGSMGASRPPLSIADTPRGGPVQSTPAPALWQGLGNHHSGPDPHWAGAATRNPTPSMGLPSSPRASSYSPPTHPWSPGKERTSGGSQGQRGKRGRGRGGKGLSPSLHCPLSCPCWPPGCPRRTSESRPWRAA